MIFLFLNLNDHLNLQLIPSHDLVFLRLELGHVPRTAHVPPRKPQPALLGHPHERVGRELRRVDERDVLVFGHAERQLRRDRPGVERDRDDAPRAILDFDELGEAEEREFVGL